MPSDLQHLQRYASTGDAHAFRELVQAHGAMVHATAFRVTRDAAAAQDVAQETFLELARKAGGITQSVAAWLHRVAWNRACDAVRRESTRKRFEQAMAETWHTDREATWPDIEPHVDASLNELPNELREVLVLYFLEGRTQAEVARHLGKNQATVSRSIERGISAMREALRSRGVIAGTGLAALFTAQNAQAMPVAVQASLGKLSVTGIGTGTSKGSTLLVTSTLITMTTTKILLGTLFCAATGLLLYQIYKPMPAAKPAVQASKPAPVQKPPSLPRISTPLSDAEVDSLIHFMQVEERAFGWQPESQAEAIGLSLGSTHRHILGLTQEPHPDEMDEIQAEGKRAAEKVSRMMHEVTNAQTASDYSSGVLSAALNLDAEQASELRSILHDAYAETYSGSSSPARAYQRLIQNSNKVFGKIRRLLSNDQSSALTTLYGPDGSQFFKYSLFQPAPEK